MKLRKRTRAQAVVRYEIQQMRGRDEQYRLTPAQILEEGRAFELGESTPYIPLCYVVG